MSKEHSFIDFNGDGTHRLMLCKIWDIEKPRVMFIGLNPSTANDDKDHATIRVVRNISKRHGYGGFYMMNLFTQITAFPEQLIPNSDHTITDIHINGMAENCKDIVFAWGNWKVGKQRGDEMIKRFPNALCLRRNKNGSPHHPLYLPKDIQLIPFNL